MNCSPSKRPSIRGDAPKRMEMPHWGFMSPAIATLRSNPRTADKAFVEWSKLFYTITSLLDRCVYRSELTQPGLILKDHC